MKKSFIERFFENHVLANLFFSLVLLLGTLSYINMPRQQDPNINFNWINITTILPGASAAVIEEKVTQILEEGLATIQDIKFVSSVSRQNISSILLRFNDIESAEFDKRLQDIRRIIQNKQAELPEDASDPDIFEVTSSNAFPSAMVVVQGEHNNEQLRQAARQFKTELERLKAVDRVNVTALHNPQINIEFTPEKLGQYQISLGQLIRTIQGSLYDISAGDVDVKGRSWLVTLKGVGNHIDQLTNLPIKTPTGYVPLSLLAQVTRAQVEHTSLASFNNKPASMLAVMKKDRANLLDTVQEIKDRVAQRNATRPDGIQYFLADDQTEITRNALKVMEGNFAIGIVLVLLVAWLFLGSKVAFMTTLGIPFTIAGTMWVMHTLGFTLNVSVLLGVVIALGMLVDDAVVVVESIALRLRQGNSPLQATLEGISEVIAPVTTSVLTTIAAFLPLMLLPGILGKFMLVVPLVVTIALIVSLLEAYWLLPTHITMIKSNFDRPSKTEIWRRKALNAMQRKYSRALIKSLRFPKTVVLSLFLLFAGTITTLASGVIPFNFFANDALRVYYISVRMPSEATLTDTMNKVNQVANTAKMHLQDEETRSVLAYAGQMFTETEPFIGKQYGQVYISLHPQGENLRTVEQVIAAMKDDVEAIQGAESISFLKLAGGPPAGRDISLKILGDDFDIITQAGNELLAFMRQNPIYQNLQDDNTPGTWGMDVSIDYARAQQIGISSDQISQEILALIDGITIGNTLINNEFIDIKLRAQPGEISDIYNTILNHQIVAQDGTLIPLRNIVTAQAKIVKGNIRHYNFKRALTLEADIDKSKTDTVAANNLLFEHWAKIQKKYPSLSIDTSGALDDIEESISAIATLFIFGLGLMYLILGTQFRSYFQPLLVLSAVPMAFIGVTLGLLITGNPISLYTLYGIVALSGLAVNASIVMISTANRKREMGMSAVHSIFYAAKRRLIPIMITSLTTIAGLFSLATGIGGESLLWGPVAISIVSGLIISTMLSIFVLPSLYVSSYRSYMWFSNISLLSIPRRLLHRKTLPTS